MNLTAFINRQQIILLFHTRKENFMCLDKNDKGERWIYGMKCRK